MASQGAGDYPVEHVLGAGAGLERVGEINIRRDEEDSCKASRLGKESGYLYQAQVASAFGVAKNGVALLRLA